MPVRTIELTTTPPEVQFAVAGLMPAGYVTLLFGHAGTGKTRLLSYLAVQAARPEGTFANRRVVHGRTVILDADDPQGLGYALWLNRFLAGYPDANRKLLDVRAVDGGLEPEDVTALQDELISVRPAFIVVDAFSSAFVGVDPLKPHTVHAPIRALTDLAAKTGACVLLVDHVGKLQPGQTVAAKGALGSVIKQASPRAVFALERVPPKECDGEDVMKLTCTKQSYAPLPPPLGLRLAWKSENQCTMDYYPLPEAETLEEKAKNVMRTKLKAAGEAGIRRADLLKAAVREANVSRRTAERAFAELMREEPGLEERRLPGRGAPSLVVCSNLAQNRENAVQDGKRFYAKGLALNQSLASNRITPDELMTRAWGVWQTLPEGEEKQHWSLRLNREREKAARDFLSWVEENP